MRAAIHILCAAALAAALASDAGAEPHALEHDLTVDLTLTLAAGATWIGFELLQDEVAPSACRWCAGNALDDAARDALRWRASGTAYALSSVFAYAVVPAAALGAAALDAVPGGGARGLGLDVLLVAEAATVTMVLAQLAKVGVARRRPWVGEDPARPPSERNLAFFSGHTAFAFAVAGAGTTVAYRRGYRTAPWVAAASFTLAAATGYLRLAADQHHLTDVLAGAAIGAGAGVAIPWWLHPRRAARVALLPAPGGLVVLGRF